MSRRVVGIVGFGYVGKAMARFLHDHYDVLVYDPFVDLAKDAPQSEKVRQVTFEELNQKASIAIVCAPTPMGKKGDVDTSAVEDSIGRLRTRHILIKSTVPPGTTERLMKRFRKKIAFSPEYIGEGNYVVQWWKADNWPHPTDMKYHDFHIFGGHPEAIEAARELYKPVVGAGVRYISTTASTAELTKYIENAWLATKITFCNEFADIADAFGVSYDELRELWLLDGRVGRSHTVVFKDKRGFSGKCLPKDTSGIIKASEAVGCSARLLKAVLSVNEEIRSRQRNGRKTSSSRHRGKRGMRGSQ